MRRGYLALTWPPASCDGAEHVRRLRARLGHETGWREAHVARGLSVWLQPDSALGLRRLGRTGLVLGDLHPNPGASATSLGAVGAAPARPHAAARQLLRLGWGCYVALLHDPGDDSYAALRDPSGLIGCATWSLGDGVVVVAGDVSQPPAWLRPRQGFLDWAAIAAFLAAPAVAMTASLFADTAVVPPGGLQPLAAGRPGDLAWNPVAFAANSHRDLAFAATEVLARLEACTSALVSRHERVLLELSGGLDSSIVGGVLGATGDVRRVAAWLNYRYDRAEADESRYARAVTDRLGVPLTTPRGWAEPIDEAALKEIGAFAWPAIGGADAGRDRDELGRLTRTGATAIVSGQGGDGVFFQFPTALVLADALQRDGWRALASPLPAAVARRTRQSVWAVLRQVRAARRGRARTPRTLSRLLSAGAAEAGAAAVHPWVRAARNAGLPPGKALHVQGIAVTHLYGGPSRRLVQADIVLPMFAQPVVELCLGLAVPDLAGESYDRPFARTAFRSRLPAEVLDRRSKGDMSTYYGKLAAMSLPTLRPYLLEGCLAEAGLLDRGKLLGTLEPEHLLRGGAGSAMDVLNAAAVEAWVRHWQTQVPDAPTANRWSVA